MPLSDFTYFLIEDDPDDQEFFCSALEAVSPGSQCITAVNGHQALEMLRTGRVKADVIFLDLNMPLMNGFQFLEEIKKSPEFTEIPIIVLSTSSDQISKQKSLRLGARNFLTKPHKFSDWEDIVKKQLQTLKIES
jgi:CheY-like chemotaxis protein